MDNSNQAALDIAKVKAVAALSAHMSGRAAARHTFLRDAARAIFGRVEQAVLVEDFSTGESEVSEENVKAADTNDGRKLLELRGSSDEDHGVVREHADGRFTAFFTATSAQALRDALVNAADLPFAVDQTPLKRALAAQDAYKVLREHGVASGSLQSDLRGILYDVLHGLRARGVSAEGRIVDARFEGAALLVTIVDNLGKRSSEWLDNLTLV